MATKPRDSARDAEWVREARAYRLRRSGKVPGDPIDGPPPEPPGDEEPPP